jgi:hypothetical protein
MVQKKQQAYILYYGKPKKNNYPLKKENLELQNKKCFHKTSFWEQDRQHERVPFYDKNY